MLRRDYQGPETGSALAAAIPAMAAAFNEGFGDIVASISGSDKLQAKAAAAEKAAKQATFASIMARNAAGQHVGLTLADSQSFPWGVVISVAGVVVLVALVSR